jgi:methionine synthase II (cobalamin-independent)
VDILSHEFAASPHLFNVFSEYESSKQMCVGVVRSDEASIESIDTIRDRINKAQNVFGESIMQLAPDCGLRMLSQAVAFEKLKRLVQAKRMVYD